MKTFKVSSIGIDKVLLLTSINLNIAKIELSNKKLETKIEEWTDLLSQKNNETVINACKINIQHAKGDIESNLQEIEKLNHTKILIVNHFI